MASLVRIASDSQVVRIDDLGPQSTSSIHLRGSVNGFSIIRGLTAAIPQRDPNAIVVVDLASMRIVQKNRPSRR